MITKRPKPSWLDFYDYDAHTHLQTEWNDKSWSFAITGYTIITADPCEGDFDGDNDVDDADLAVFTAEFGRSDCGSDPPCDEAFGTDGDVDGADLAVLAADYGRADCEEL